MSNANTATAGNKTMTYTLTDANLPESHKEREQIADDLAEAGHIVKVNRFGTGNGAHSGIIAGCGVASIEVTER